MVDFATKVTKIQINTLYKSENLASALLSASCEILNDFKKYPEPEHNRLKERKEKKKKSLIINYLRKYLLFLFFDKIAYFYPCSAKINTFLTPQFRKILYLCKR